MADLINILQEVRGTHVAGGTPTDGIYYELTMEPTDGNPGIYGDFLAKYRQTVLSTEGLREIYNELMVGDSEHGVQAKYDIMLDMFNQSEAKFRIFAGDNPTENNGRGDGLFNDLMSTIDSLNTSEISSVAAVADEISAIVQNVQIMASIVANQDNIDIVATDLELINSATKTVAADLNSIDSKIAQAAQLANVYDNTVAASYITRAFALTVEAYLETEVNEKVQAYVSNGDGTYDRVQTQSYSMKHYSTLAITAAASAEISKNAAILARDEATAAADLANVKADLAVIKATAAAGSASDAQQAQIISQGIHDSVEILRAQASSSAIAASASAISSHDSAIESATSTQTAVNAANRATVIADQVELAASSVSAMFDSFDDRFLGTKGVDPIADNDGEELRIGTMYYNSTALELRFFNGVRWEAPDASAAGSATSASNSAQSARQSAISAEESANTSEAAADVARVASGVIVTAKSEVLDAADAVTIAKNQTELSATAAQASRDQAQAFSALAHTDADKAELKALEAASSALSARNASQAAIQSNLDVTTAVETIQDLKDAADLELTQISQIATSVETSVDDAQAAADAAALSAQAAQASKDMAELAKDSANTSANTAHLSEVSATTSANNSELSATASADSADEAYISASNADTSATTAAQEALSATDSKNAAAISAATASDKAEEARLSAVDAATAASTASAKAAQTVVLKSDVQTMKTAVESLVNSFDDMYLGAKSTNPTVDNDGDSLQKGALYFNTTSDSLRVYTGTAWDTAVVSLNGVLLTLNNLSDIDDVVVARANLNVYSKTEIDTIVANYIPISNIYDALDSLDSNKVLSAAQGKILDDSITAIENMLTVNDSNFDTLQEVVTFIKNNKLLLDSLAISDVSGLSTALNSKINTADIVDDLNTASAVKVLSAAQGKVLKDLIDTIMGSNDINLDTLQEVVDYIKLNKQTLEALSISSIAGLQAALNAKLDADQVLTPVPANAVFTDTVYVKPASEPISYISGLLAALDSKALAANLLTPVPLNAVFTDTVYDDTPVVSHIAATDNPHSVTAAQVGLGSVDNTSDIDKPVSTAQSSAINSRIARADIVNNTTSTSTTKVLSANQGKVLKDYIVSINSVLDTTISGLDTLQEIGDAIQALGGNVDNLAITDIDGLVAALNGKVDDSQVLTDVPANAVFTDTTYTVQDGGLTEKNFTAGLLTKLNGIEIGANAYTHPASHQASMIVQSATRRFVTDTEKAEWSGKEDALGYVPEDSADKGIANGYAPLDANAKIALTNLYEVIVTRSSVASLQATPMNTTSLYVDTSTDITYRWSGTGTDLVAIGKNLDLGETSTTAYRGDRGKIAYDHSQTTHDKAMVGLSNVDNTSDLDKPLSTAASTAIAAKANSADVFTQTEITTKLTAKLDVASVINNLTSTVTNQPLSAAQGRALKQYIDQINTLLTSNDTTLDELQEIVDFIKTNKSTLDNLGISNIAGLSAALDGKFSKGGGILSGGVTLVTSGGSYASQRDNNSVALSTLNGVGTGAYQSIIKSATENGVGIIGVRDDAWEFISFQDGNTTNVPDSIITFDMFTGIINTTGSVDAPVIKQAGVDIDTIYRKIDGNELVITGGSSGNMSTASVLKFVNTTNNQDVEFVHDPYDAGLPETGYAVRLRKSASNTQTYKTQLIVEGNIYANDTDKVLTEADALDADTLDGVDSLSFSRTDIEGISGVGKKRIELSTIEMGDTATDTYVVLAKSHPDGVSKLAASSIVGTITASRGSTTSGNKLAVLDVAIQTAYQDTHVMVDRRIDTYDSFMRIDEISIDGTPYIALRMAINGGAFSNGVVFDGEILGNDVNVLSVVQESDSNVILMNPGKWDFEPDVDEIDAVSLQGNVPADFAKVNGDITEDFSANTMTTEVTNTNTQATAREFHTKNVSSYDKFSVWNSSIYAIGMMDGMSYGDIANEYAMTFTMANGSARGFVWRDTNDTKAEGAMSLTLDGQLTVDKTVTVPKVNYGSNKEATIEYNATTQSLDFIIN